MERTRQNTLRRHRPTASSLHVTEKSLYFALIGGDVFLLRAHFKRPAHGGVTSDRREE
jgi:hypothetical protein